MPRLEFLLTTQHILIKTHALLVDRLKKVEKVVGDGLFE